MAIKKDSYELLIPIFESIDKTFKVESIDTLTIDTFRIYSCNTLWITLNRIITINGNDYKVIDIVPNEYIDIKGAIAPDVDEFDIYAPHWFRNTVKEQNILLALIDQKGQWTDKTPMIWVHTITRENVDKSVNSAIDRASDYDIFFLSNYDPENWLTEDHYKYVITPMRNLLDAFIDAYIQQALTYPHDLKYEQYDHVKLSLQTSKNESPTNDFLSGTQFRGQLVFMRGSECYC